MYHDTKKKVRITSKTFDGPIDKPVVTFDEIYHLGHGGPVKLGLEDFEVKFAALLAQAAFSGFDVEITKDSDPAKGMGGYIPHIKIQPDFATMRAKMTELAEHQAHFAQHGVHGFTPATPPEIVAGDDWRPPIDPLSHE